MRPIIVTDFDIWIHHGEFARLSHVGRKHLVASQVVSEGELGYKMSHDHFWELGFIVSGYWPLLGLHSAGGCPWVWPPSYWKMGNLGGRGPVPIWAGLEVSSPGPMRLGFSASSFMCEALMNVWRRTLSMAVARLLRSSAMGALLGEGRETGAYPLRGALGKTARLGDKRLSLWNETPTNS